MYGDRWLTSAVNANDLPIETAEPTQRRRGTEPIIEACRASQLPRARDHNWTSPLNGVRTTKPKRTQLRWGITFLANPILRVAMKRDRSRR